MGSNFDRMQEEFAQMTRKSEERWADIKKAQYEAIHQVCIDTDAKLASLSAQIDAKLGSLQQQIGSASTRADSDFELVGGDGDGGRRKLMRTSGPDQASATRLIVLGFEKPLLEASLKEAVAPIVAACSPTGEEPIVRAYSLTRKVILDFPSTLSCTAFFGKSQSIGKTVYQNPIGGLGWELRVRRDLPPASRKLFYYLGQPRAIIGKILGEKGFQVGSNGLGEQIYGLLTPAHPVIIAKVNVLECGRPELVLIPEALGTFGVGEHDGCIATLFGQIRPFV